jgi:hypothetical protein
MENIGLHILSEPTYYETTWGQIIFLPGFTASNLTAQDKIGITATEQGLSFVKLTPADYTPLVTYSKGSFEGKDYRIEMMKSGEK